MNNVTPLPRTALVVEDDEHMLTFLHEVLEDAGFETTGVAQGKLALTVLAERCFDLLLVEPARYEWAEHLRGGSHVVPGPGRDPGYHRAGDPAAGTCGFTTRRGRFPRQAIPSR